MQFKTVTNNDLEEIRDLQPEGWNDITDAFRFYTRHDYCYPLLVSIKNRIVGLGCSIIFEKTAWLAHIIVSREYRRKGIGYQIVQELLTGLKDKSIESVLLTATEASESVYRKAGFRLVSDYLFFNREEIPHGEPWKKISDKIHPCQPGHHTDILRLDKEISGEDRKKLIGEYIDSSFVYIDGNITEGFYIPGLGEGPILAGTVEAGTELMKLKYSNINKAVIPYENITGIEILEKGGFTVTETKGRRMIMGKDIKWQPGKIFSRIGGNYG
jgi:GNAT superfamily N-acetyltransferase